MKVLPFKIPKTEASSIRVQVDHQPYFYDILHQHPEIQITLIVSGTGTLFQGEYIGDYKPGDVFIVGANVPHVLKSDDRFYKTEEPLSHAISIFFDEESLGRGFFDLPELKDVKQLLNQSHAGISLSGVLKDKVGEHMIQMPEKDGLVNIITLMEILNQIATSEDIRFLSSDYTPYMIDEIEGERLSNIFQFTFKEHNRLIKLEEVAALAHMTPSAFCRYFKQRTRKTYVNFLNEIRIAEACKLLLNEDLSVSQVCYQCGFNNLSHFNRVFKSINGDSPSVFRKNRTAYG